MTLTIGIEVENLPGMWRRLRALPKTAQQELRDAARMISDDEAARIRSAAAGDSPQAAAVAPFIRARRDRVPAIVAGGHSKAGVSGGAKAGEVFFGAEFGGRGRKRRKAVKHGSRVVVHQTTLQFRPHRGREGYWFFETLRADQERMMRRYEGALRAIEREWSRG